MADQGRILAIQMNTPRTITTLNGVQEQLGYRLILSVRMILAKVQTTVLFGNDLYGIGLMSNLDEMTIFKNFVTSFANRPEIWLQLVDVPNPPVPYPSQLFAVRPTYPPSASGPLVVLDAGYDAMQGYWIAFAGNYFLTFPIFKNFPNVIRDGPDYNGFQPSLNNAVTPGSNGGLNGGNGSTC